MPTCIDLKARFGHRYRVDYEESYRAECGDSARAHDPWLLTIPCRHGHIYPHGGELLAASTNRRGPITNRLAALPCVCVVQDGDDGINVLFHASDLDKVAAILKPKRRRRLSPEHRVKLTTAGIAALDRHRNSNDARSDRRGDVSDVPGSLAI